MTVRQLYEAGCYLVYEVPDDDDELKDAFPSILNQLVEICRPYENQFRRNEGAEDMTAPFYTTADDENELPFHEVIARAALPFGVQSKFYEADDDKKAESVLAYNKFIDALNSMTPAIETDVMGVDMDEYA